MDQFIDDTLVITPKSGHGKFSLYFVFSATVLTVIIFIFQLVKLIRQCRKDSKAIRDRDLFARVGDYSGAAHDDDASNEIKGNIQLSIQGVDPNGLLSDSKLSS